MRIGADAAALDRLASRHDGCVELLVRTRARVGAVDRRGWCGPEATRLWRFVDHALVPALAIATWTTRESARELRSQARAQRRASLAMPVASTVRVDRRGDGRWVGRIGRPDAAAVVVLVPGVGTDLADVARLRADGARVWRWVAAHSESGDDVAVVSWLGYDPPDTVVGGVDPVPAVAGALQLVPEVASLRSAGARRVVVAGHSYGALVAARASSAGMDADELVLLGAPGLGVAGPAAMGVGPDRGLWAAAAAWDPISLVARAGIVHGPDPVRFARVLPTAARGHGGYLGDAVLLDALGSVTVNGTLPR